MKQNITIELFSLVNHPFAFGNEEGRAVNQKMAKIIDENPLQNIFGVSLKGMQFIDASFARESVITLAKQYRTEKGFYLQDFASKDIEDNWDYAAAAKDQPILIWNTDGSYKLLGQKLPSSTLELLDFIHQQGEVTTSKVASKFELSTQNASGKLKKMFMQGLILGSKEIAESGGLEFIYTAIK